MLHLISTAGPHPYFELFGAHANRRRFDLRLASLGPAGALQEDARRMGFPSLAFNAAQRTAYPRAMGAIARYLRAHRIDVIQTHLLDACVVGLSAARLAGTPVRIFTAHHSHEIPLHRRWALSAVDRLAAGRLANIVVSPSEQMRQTLIDVQRLDPDHVRVIPHGFELDRLDPDGVDGSDVGRELGLDGRLVISSVGRLFWIKNQEALVRAFAAAAPQQAVLLLAGSGDEAGLRRLVSDLGEEERVHVLGHREDVPEILAASNLYVHPAIAESFGMALLEAMSMGLPVVSAPVGIATDVIGDGDTGVLADGPSAEGLTRALKQALAARDDWPAMGAAARRRATAFPADGMIRAHEELYERCLSA